MQPYNYDLGSPDYIGDAYRGFRMGQEQKKARQLDEASALTLDRQAKLNNDLIMLSENPTIENIQSTIIRNPSLSDKFKPIVDRMSEQEKVNQVSHAYKVVSALDNDRPDLAKDLLERRAVSFENDGKTQQAEGLRSLINQVDASPGYVKANTAAYLNALQGTEKFTENLSEFMGIQPGIAETQARTKKLGEEVKGIKADIMDQEQERTQKDLDRPLEREVKELERDKVKLEYDRLADDKGLLYGEDRRRAASDFHDDYVKETKDFADTELAYRKLLASEDTPQGDIAMIFQYMKMLDPGSVVREGEFATAQNAGDISERVRNMYNKTIKGGRLQPSQRKKIASQSKSIFNATKAKEKRVRDGITRIAGKYGIKPDEIFYEESVVDPEVPVGLTAEAPQDVASQGQPGRRRGRATSQTFSVTTPDGRVYNFPSAEAAQGFRNEAGL